MIILFTDSSKRNRRVSTQTDVSVPTESESEDSDSETDLTRTRSGAKPDESEYKSYRRRVIKRTMVIVLLKTIIFI